VTAIEAGEDAPAPLVARVRELEARRDALGKELAACRPMPRLAPAVVENRLAEWRRLLRQSPTQGRAVLQRVLRGRLTFTPRPDGRGYDFTAPTRFDRLFSGVAAPRPGWIAEGDARGTAHLTSADTLEGDYGQLLERATRQAVKWVATLEGFEPSIFTLKG
jgi:hypothetical protein